MHYIAGLVHFLGIAFAVGASTISAVRVLEKERTGFFEHIQTQGGLWTQFQCTREQKEDLWIRFQIGEKRGKPCRQEKSWGQALDYINPQSQNSTVLYLYPAVDHNGAFNLCTDKHRFNLYVCHVLLSLTEHHSVMFRRVSSIEQARHWITQLHERQVSVKILVLGGHGDKEGLQWGEDDEPGSELNADDSETGELLDDLYRLLKPDSRVFLDACETGRYNRHGKNFAQYVAHRLAPIPVQASKVSFSSDMMYLADAQNLDIAIREGPDDEEQAVTKMFEGGPLRDWEYLQGEKCTDRNRKREKHISGLQECRKLCEALAEKCKAIIWYPDTIKAHDKANTCTLSPECAETEYASQAVTFIKPHGTEE